MPIHTQNSRVNATCFARSSLSSYLILGFILLFYVLLVAQYSRRFEWNLSGFACIGDRFKVPHFVTDKTYVFNNSDGYDGQFFFFAAHDPLILHNDPTYLDSPAYRSQRLLYPLLAHVLSAGNQEWLPFLLVAINVGSVFFGSFVVLCWLRDQRLNLGWTFAYAFTGGFALCVFRDLSEPLALALMVSGLYAQSKGHFKWMAFFLGLMILTRETLLIVNACIVACALAKKSGRELFWSVCSLIPFGAWQGLLYLKFHNFAFRGGKNNFGKPFVAMQQYFSQVLAEPEHLAKKSFVALFLLLVVFAGLLAVFEIFRKRNALTLSFFIYGVQPFFMTNKVWVEPWSYARVLLPLFIFLILNFIETRGNRYVPLLFANMLLFFMILLRELNG